MNNQETKKCKVLTRNEAVTVIEYNGTPVQFTSSIIDNQKEFVWVNYEDGKYSIVDESNKKSNPDKNVRKAENKKTTKDEMNRKEIVSKDDEGV